MSQMYACSEPITFSANKNTTYLELLQELSVYCKFSLVTNGELTKKALDKKSVDIRFEKQPLDAVLQRVLVNNNFNYIFADNTLKVDYVYTKSYHVDYILTNRQSLSSTNITIASQGSSSNNENNTNTSVGVNLQTSENFEFWSKEIEGEIQQLLNRPEDGYDAPKPLINKVAGVVSISATRVQHERIARYFDELKSKLYHQVLIDLHIYAIDLNTENALGVDWGKIGSFLNLKLSISGELNAPVVKLENSISLENILSFLDSNGNVEAISNPKVMSLHNQPAIISVGKEIYYKIKQSTVVTNTSTTTQNSESIHSVFAGIMLDITPAITQDGMIMLKINPSISTIDTTTQSRVDMPPDLYKKQISSVVKLGNNETVVLGGLIEKVETDVISRFPVLGYIPVLDWFFSHTKKVATNKELIILITPSII